MFALSTFLQALAVILLLPLTIAAPAPDSIFLLQKSTFAPLGCSRSFHPTSILRQVPSPFACFSRCSDRQIAAYSQLQSGVLCACGSEDMISGVGEELTRCRDDTWFLFSNEDLDKAAPAPDAEAKAEADVAQSVNKAEKRERLMPFMMMKKRITNKIKGAGQVI